MCSGRCEALADGVLRRAFLLANRGGLSVVDAVEVELALLCMSVSSIESVRRAVAVLARRCGLRELVLYGECS